MRLRMQQRLEGVQEARDALEALVLRNLGQLRRRRYPPLMKSGARYRREARVGGRPAEHWQTIREVNESGFGDCEDLAAYRVAYLRHTGEDKRARVAVRNGGSPYLWHVYVRRGNGREEDPSKWLGMKGEA